MNPSLPQPTLSPCPTCGGQRVVNNFYEGRLGRYKSKRGAGQTPPFNMEALLCTQCGQITLRVDNMQVFRDDLTKHPETYGY